MPILEFICEECGLKFDSLIRKPEDMEDVQCGCGSVKVTKALSFPSNYTISGNNSASVRPRRMGGGK